MSAILLIVTACGTQEQGDLREPINDMTGLSGTENSYQESPNTEMPEAEQIQPDTTEIKLTFSDEIVFAMMDDSETTQAFLERLPLTLSMNRYGEREYYASIAELPENGQDIPDFENGDITYYTAGKSLAIFFGNEENSSQGDLIRMGKIISDLGVFDTMEENVSVKIETAYRQEGELMQEYDFSIFSNVELMGADLSVMSSEQTEVLYRQAMYCQAMTEADIDTMKELVSEDMVFTHMSGRQQTREEYFADVEDGSLLYFTIGIDGPVVEVDGDLASVTYTSVLNANAYGARGTYRMGGHTGLKRGMEAGFPSMNRIVKETETIEEKKEALNEKEIYGSYSVYITSGWKYGRVRKD